jgi:ABC-type branched-subunit amino acid transport system ATPase component
MPAHATEPASPPPAPGESRAEDPPPLAVTGLRKSFGGVRVLHDFELTIPAQSQEAQSREAPSQEAPSRAAGSPAAVAILGQNGAGKTTLLNLITRIVPADAGRIEVFGHDVLRSSARHLAGYGVARTFQSPRLLLDETCLNNVALGAQSVRGGRHSLSRDRLSRDRPSRDRSRAAALRRAADALDQVGLAGQASRIAGTLPFGSRKLVELARALALQPRLLLLDEPAAGLSDLEESRLAGVLTGLTDAGITLLLIEHRMALVAATAGRVVMMDGGAIVFDGDTAAAVASPLVRERYLGAGFDQGKPADLREPRPEGNQSA